MIAGNSEWTGVVWNIASGHEVARPTSIDRANDGEAFVSFSPDEDLLVVSTHSTELQVIKAATGEPVGAPLSHSSPARLASFGPDGSWVMTKDASVYRFWNTRTGAQTAGDVCETIAYATSIHMGKNGSLVAARMGDGSIGVFDVGDSGSTELARLRRDGFALSVLHFAGFDEEKFLLVSADEKGGIHLWERKGPNDSGKPVCEWANPGHTHADYAIVSPDGNLVAAFWGTNGKLFHRDHPTDAYLTLAHAGAGYYTPKFSEDGDRILGRSSDGVDVVWDTATGRRIPDGLDSPERAETIRSTLYSTDLRRIVAWTVQDSAILLDGETGEPIATLMEKTPVRPVGAASADARLLVTASGRDACAQVWDVASGEETVRLAGHTAGVLAVAISADGKLAATGSYDRTARVWVLSRGECVQTLGDHDGPVERIAMTGDATRLVTVSDRTARLWSLGESRPPIELGGHNQPIHVAAFSADGATLVTASPDAVRVWRIDSQSVSGTLIHAGGVNTALFSPDGRLLATLTNDRAIDLWDSHTGERKRQIDAGAAARCLAFSQCGRRLLVGVAGGACDIRDTATGEKLARLEGHLDDVTVACFSADASRVFTASKDRSVQVWDAVRGRQLIPLAESGGVHEQLWLTGDDRRLLGVRADGQVSVWDSEPEVFILDRAKLTQAAAESP